MKREELTAWLAAQGVEVFLANGRLNYRSATPPGEATLARLRERREELVAWLESGELTHGQASLWFLWKIEPQSIAYNTALALQLDPATEIAPLERALAELHQRHSALRSRFRQEGGVPRREAGREAPCLEVTDATGWSEAESAAALAALADRPFDLERGPVARWHLLAHAGAPGRKVLLFAAHHIVMDFRSLEIVVRDLGELYEAERDRRAAALPLLTAGWREAAAQEREWLASAAGQAAEAWWLERLGGEPAPLELPGDFPRPAQQSFAGDARRFTLPAGPAGRLREFAQAQGLTPHVVLLAAFGLLLSRYARRSEFTLGLPMQGRHREAWADMVGYFVNPVVLRLAVDERATGLAWLARVREAVVESLERHEYPFPLLVEALNPRRDAARSPLFQAAFVYERPAAAPPPLVERVLWGGQRGAVFDLTLTAREEGEALQLTWEYATALFRPERIETMQAHFATLLEALTQRAGEPCRALSLLTAADRRALAAANATAAPAPGGSLLDLLEAQAARTPAAPAVQDGDRVWSHGGLHAWAEALAERLRAAGARRNAPVGIALPRGAELLGTLLAVMKAGGACLPLDLESPAERLRFMLAESAAPLLVTDTATASSLDLANLADLAVLRIDDGAPAPAPAPRPRAERCRPDDILYVLYTSGSSGRPKGVAMSHAAIVNLVRWQSTVPGLDRPARVLQYTPPTFDVSFQEIATTWAAGGALVIVGDWERRDSRQLLRLLGERGIERLFLPFVALQALAETAAGGLPDSLLDVITAGEQLHATPALRACFRRSRARLHNHYGPTETHVATAHTLPRDVAAWAPLPPIGRPIANLQAWLLDADLQPLPPAIPGELYLGGLGLAQGYHRRADLTAERFLDHPELGRLYRTGDLARWREGQLEYLGRSDTQIKLRGFRIELQEIEAVLAAHAGVAEAAVVAYGEGEAKRLAAFLSLRAGASGPPPDLAAYLRARLPAYMVPTNLVVLQALPKTRSGKLDRGALPDPGAGESAAAGTPPRTETERLVAAAWTALLGLARADVHANYFSLGGHSLLAARLLARLRQVTGVELPLRAIFQHPTIAGLAEQIEAQRSGIHAAPAEPVAGLEPAVSFEQRRLWYLEQLEGPSPVYHMAATFELDGPLALDALRQAFRRLVERHASLRSAFPSENGVPRLALLPPFDPLRVTDLESLPAEAARAEAARLERNHRVLPFDLAHGPLLRVHCLRFGPDRHWLLINLHHIVCDGWSLGVLTRELGEIYRAVRDGDSPALAPLPMQFGEYAAWQRERMRDAGMGGQLAYWQQRLADMPPLLDLPADRARPQRRSFRGGVLRQTLDRGLRRELQRFNAAEGSTPFISLLAVLNALLWRYTGRADLPIGTAVGSREHAVTESMIGLLVNTLVLRTRVDGEASFRALVEQVRDVSLEAYAHRDLPFEALVEALKPERSLSFSPLFQVCCVLVSDDLEWLPLTGLRSRALPSGAPAAKFDLTLYIEDLPDRLQLVWEYDADLFDAERIARLAGHFERLLQGLLAAPEDPIGRAAILTPREAREIREWSRGAARPPAWTNLVEALEAAAAARPAQPALMQGDRRLSLGEWNAAANRLARYLAARGARRGEIVAVCLPRGIEALVAILAVLKTGAAYLPLDPNHPAARLDFILADAAAPCLVTDREAAAPPGPCRLCRVDAEAAQIAREADTNLPLQSGPDDRVYAIYTSGSTGRPKGAAALHRGFANLLQWYQRRLGLQPDDCTLLLSALGFDLTQKNLFAPPLAGGRLVLPAAERFDPAAVAAEIARHGVTHVNCTPSTFYPLLRDTGGLGTLRHVVLGGEPIQIERLRGWLGGGGARARIHNTYGPTECTDICTEWNGDARTGETFAPLGRPIDNVEVHVLDAALQPVAVGIPGDLWIGGAGVGSGYLRNAELNAAAFRTVETDGAPQRLYRTGDRARRRSDGVLEYLGRDDDQIKLRGFRIELGEIEAALRAQPGVREAAVAVRGESGDNERRQLVAYVAGEADADALRAALQAALPAFMVPSRIVALASLPLTANGKVDRQALPAPPEAPAADRAEESPRGPAEEAVARIWRELLGLRAVGRHEAFFACGGHSLLAVQLAARLGAAFGVELPLRVLYDGPTIARLAAWMEAQPRRQAPLAAAPQAPLELSFAQRRLWFLDRLEGGNAAYNVPGALEIRGELDAPILRRALSLLVERHAMLRLAIATRQGEPEPRLIPPYDPIEATDLGGLPPDAAAAEADRMLAAHAAAKFDLAAGRLFRLHLIRLGPQRHWLAINLHHIVCDAWSVDLLIRELAAGYSALRRGAAPAAAPPALEYNDYARAQRQALAADSGREQLDWWKQQLADAPDQLEIPTDFLRPRDGGGRGGEVTFPLEAEAVAALTAAARGVDATPFMALLAAFNALLYRSSGQADLCVGTPVANRNRVELESVVGLFLNTLPIRTRIPPQATFLDVVAEVRAAALGAYGRQEIPFEYLVEELRPRRSLARHPIFQVMLNLVGSGVEPPVLEGCEVRRLAAPGGQAAKFDLSLSLTPQADGGIEGRLEYNAGLFTRETAAWMAACFARLVREAGRRPEARLSTIALVDAAAPCAPHTQGPPRVEFGGIECTLPERFAERVARHGERVAVRTPAATLTYRELDRVARQLAATLLRRTPRGGVALLLPHGALMPAGILAALMAGKYYVPLDAAHPDERLRRLLEAADVECVISGGDLLPRAAALAGGAQVVDAGAPAGTPLASFAAASPDSLAYLLYTSGSTGRPKGVVQNHRNVLHFMREYSAGLGIVPADRLLQVASYAFDAGVMDTFAALLNGAALYPVDLRRLGPEAACGWMAAEGVTIYHSTPTVFRLLAPSFASPPGQVRFVVLGGEAARRGDFELYRDRFGPACRLVNGLGPSESTVTLQRFFNRHETVERDSLPVGFAVGQTEVLLLDPEGNPTDLFGEVVIRGPHVALEYWRQAGDTLGADPDRPGLRRFRSGDLARRLPDGALEWTGRRDAQLKLRGMRIEPGEIEAALRALPNVVQAAVLPWGEGELLRLVAYVAGPEAGDEAALRAALRQRLPEAMVPARIVALPALPLLPNGKLDRRALPAPPPETAAPGENPRGEVEIGLAALWSELLGRPVADRTANFFAIGGHSLLSARLLSRIRDRFGASLELRALFERPVLWEQAEAVAGAVDGICEAEIAPLPPGAPVPLSFAQERLWFLHRMSAESDAAAYNIAAGLWLNGRPDEARLRQALLRLTERQSVLRMNVVEGEGGARAAARAAYDPLTVEDAPTQDETAWVERRAAAHARRPFDLERDPLLRLCLIRMSGERAALLFSLHHIAGDGWSLGLLVNELGELYRGRERPAPAIQYGDFAAWQRERLRGGRLEKLLAYWRDRLAGAPELLALPADHPRPAVQSHRGGQIAWELEPAVTNRLRDIGLRRGATLYMTLLAAFQALLARWSGESDIVVGSPVGHRERRETEELVGLFVNTVALRTEVRGEETFGELIGRVRETTLAAWAHQELPFEKLVEELEPRRSLSRSPIFQVMFALQNAPDGEVRLGAIGSRPMPGAGDTAKFDLTLSLRETAAGGLAGVLEYSRDLFEAATARRLGRHLGELLRGATEATQIADLPLLTEAERRQLIDWNRTESEYERDAGLWDLFARQAGARPEALAIDAASGALTYAALRGRAEGLAGQLRNAGVGAGTPVLLAAERCTEMVVGMLGVLRAGGAYLPVNANDPPARLRQMAEDAGARAVLALPADAARLAELGLAVLRLETAPAAAAPPAGPCPADGAGLACIIYTSGSTGRPKGVCIPQRGITRLARDNGFYRIEPRHRVAQLSTALFDAATFEIWGALLNGATLCMERRDDVLDAEWFLASLRAGRWDVVFLTTALFHRYARADASAFAGLEYLLFGGENADPARVRAVLEQGAPRHLLHCYGPAECTTFATLHRVASVPRDATTVPIGRAIANTSAWVLDARRRRQPVGVTGELYLGGDGLALGYAGRPETTAERFVEVAGLGRLYRTGDLARWNREGALEFLGRADTQVKLRGFRIELGEIETALCELAGVTAAAAVVQGEGELRRLLAYVAGRNEPGAEAALRAQLRQRLPDYMVPARIVVLPALPLNRNGKIDRARLPEPEAGLETRAGNAPRTPAEEVLAAIWSEVLHRQADGGLGREAHFFESGGNSLVAIQALSRMREAFGPGPSLRLLFEYPVLWEQAEAIARLAGGGEREAPIPPLPPGAPIPLSFAQERMWFLNRMGAESGDATYSVAAGLWLDALPDEARLRRALVQLTARHGSLRMNFVEDEGQARARLRPPYDPLSIEDAPELDEEAWVERRAAGHARRGFDLERDELLRLCLIRMSRQRGALLFSLHHGVADGWSLALLVAELGELYRGGTPPRPAIEYGDYAAWQRDRLQGERLERLLAYWRRQLAGAPELLALPADHPRPAVKTYRGGRVPWALEPEAVNRLRTLGLRQGATLYMTLLAALQVLLARLSGEGDIVVGSPVGHRERQECEGVVGLFVNTVALRVDIRADETFPALLRRVRSVVLEAWAHQELPFEKLVEELEPTRSLSRSPIFQAMLTLQNAPVAAVDLGGIATRAMPGQGATAKFDLLLHLAETAAGGLTGAVEFSRDLFEATGAERLGEQYRCLLRALAEEADRAVAELPLVSPAERRQLAAWNETARPYERDLSLWELFARQAAARREAPALAFAGATMSYGELRRRAEAFAGRLAPLGVGRETPVVVAVERSADLIVALLGVLRAGGAYVPVDAGEPVARLRRMAEESGARAVVAAAADRERMAALGLPVLCVDAAEGGAPPPPCGADGASLAYIMYTSGSTGRPKGVCVPQRAVARLVRNPDYVELGPEQVLLLFAPVSFDASTFEIWGALLNGGVLAIAPAGATPAELGGLIRRHGVTVLWLTAGLFHLAVEHYLDDLRGVRQLLAGGDVLSPPHVERALRELGGCRVLNGYGPTENTTFTCCHALQPGATMSGPIPIGKPIANTQVWVLDAARRLQPIGVAGELYLGGDGLARGYAAQPEATAERFVEVPGLGRLYRSGDLGRWRADGAIEFLGRADAQIKLRGFRIEPGEVEAALRELEGVEEAAVAPQGEGELRRLVAYVAARAQPGAEAAWRERLRQRLPEYMVPARVIALPRLPLTPNGKLDRARLPPADLAPESPGEAPRTPAEELLAAIWSHTLRRPAPARDDNFFESGGNSLLAMRLIASVRAAFDREIAVESVFRAPTLRALAREIDRAGRPAEAQRIEALPRDRALPLSFAQERLWFLHQLESENPFYNTPLGMRLAGPLNADALAGALQDLVDRHEVLRTAFVNDGGEPRQRPVPGVRAALAREDWRGRPAATLEAELLERARREARTPFPDLGAPPLLRAALLRLGETDHALFLTMHHIVTDGWSLNVLHGDLVRSYNARCRGESPRFEPLPVQYADFAAWQRNWLRGAALHAHLDHWRRHLAGAPPLLGLPTDRPRPARQLFRGGSVRFHIDRATRDLLLQRGRERQVTLFMTLLAAFAALLGRYSGQNDVVIGSPIANRARPELESLLGFFVNTLALRISLDGEPTFSELLRRVRRVALDAYAHQDLPFEKLVDELQPERDLSRSPLFQAMLALQNAPFEAVAADGLEFAPLTAPREAALFDLVLDLWDGADGLTAVLEYNRDLFEPATAERMARHFQTLLRGLAEAPDLPLAAVPLMEPAEAERVLAWCNGPRVAHPLAQPYPALFERQAAATPERLAAVASGATLTYGELNRRANRLAAILRAEGLQPNQPAAVLAPRGLDSLAAMLGVLKAGGMFVPIDAGYPAERVRHMLQDSCCRWLLTTEAERDALGGDGAGVARVVLTSEGARPGPAANPPGVNGSRDAMYLLYTSGSTGTPKGAVIRHDGALNHMFAEYRWLNMDAGTRFLQSAPASSDISVWQCLAPLLLGGRTVFADYATLCSPVELFRLIRDEAITLIELVPVVLEGLIHHAEGRPAAETRLPALRWAMVTGETVQPALVERWLRLWPETPLVNAYGPTEAADDICQHALREPLEAGATHVPIGRPLDNLSVMVLEAHDALAPAGVPGEICVSGIGVGAGYWNQPEKTAAAFVANPHAARTFGDTMYRTGDLGRWRSDGVLEFLGRADRQIKIRGFRVELGEIETVLAAHPQVREAVAATFDTAGGERQLAAWVQADAQGGAVAALAGEQVELWKALHDRSYGEVAPAARSVRFNTVGWDSTYTNQPLSRREMQECVANAVTRIAALRPRRLAEVGCGTGLLLFRLASRVERFLGTDFSEAAIANLRQARQDGSVAGLGGLELRRQAADDFTGLEPGEFDTLAMNSVIQYFPGAQYFLDVLRGAAARLARGGAIFVGDIRNLALLRAYHLSLREWKAGDAETAAAMRDGVAAQMRREQELALDPRLFFAPGLLPGLGDVLLRPKRGRVANEMTRFRFDAVLRLAPVEPLAPCPADCAEEWRGRELAPTAIAQRLDRERPAHLLLRRIPNARLGRERLIEEWLAAAAPDATLGALRRRLERDPDRAALDPEALWRLRRSLPYVVEILIEPDAPYDFAAHFRHRDAAPVRLDLRGDGAPPALAGLANNPLQEILGRHLIPDLRAYLKARLPGHMIPGAIEVVDRFPLAPSGKIDRAALPRPELGASRAAERVAPRTPTETLVQNVWEEVLDVAAPGVTENFFALGGHSLKATQVVSRLRQRGLELALRDLFTYPTIAELAEFAGRAPATPGPQPIARLEAADTHPVSPAQRRMWVLAQMGASAAYNMAGGLLLTGELNLDALQRSFAGLRQRYEALRTSFVEVAGELRQRVHPWRPVPFAVLDLEAQPDPEAALRRAAREDAQREHDLGHETLARISVLRLSATRHAVLFNLHHIVCDGWSLDVLVREWMRLYEAAAADRQPGLKPRPLQARDCDAWLDARRRERFAADQAWWQSQLTPPAPGLELAWDAARPAVKTYRGAATRLIVPDALSAELRRVARESGVSLATLLTALVALLLHRYSGQDDFNVGWPVAGRPHPELEDQIGLFVNTVVLRSRLETDDSFLAYLKRLHETALGALAHQEFPFDDMVRVANAPRDAARNPLFDVMVAVQNTPQAALRLGGLAIEPLEADVSRTQFDLLWNFTELQDRLYLQLRYNTDLFQAASAESLARHWLTLAASAAAAPQAEAGRLAVASPAERAQLVARRPVAAPPAYPDLATWFEAQAEAHADRIAICEAGRRLTYRELNRLANRVAEEIQSRLGGAAGDDTLVGLRMRRSIGQAIGILGILKAGAAYVPVDADAPPERARFILDDAGVALLLSDEEAPAGSAPPLGVLRPATTDPGATANPPRAGRGPERAAYLIYTSGSSGDPKGCVVTHGNVMRLFTATDGWFGFGPRDVWSLFHSCAFDFSVWEIWGALLYGGRLVVVPYEVSRDPARFCELLANEGVTVLNQTPSAFRQLLQAGEARGEALGPALRYVIFGGERLPPEMLQPWYRRHGAAAPQLVNMYGITETTVHVTYRPLAPADALQAASPIGEPIPDLALYVLDAHREPVPAGMPGELYVGGAGVARGYWRRPELTAERFLDNPFQPGGRLYRTGDRVRLAPSGELVYLGRLDGQAKIRGHRIECGEIEQALARHPGIAAAVARVAGGSGEAVVHAWYVGDEELAPETLRAFLARRLPEYMLPLTFTRLARLPLTANGKLDERALPAPAVRVAAGGTRRTAQAGLEADVVAVWRRLLRLDDLGPDDNVFDYGAQSLLAVAARNELQALLGRPIPIVLLFQHASAAALAAALQAPPGDPEPETAAPARARRRRAAAAGRGRGA